METRRYVAPARTKLQMRCPLQSSRWRLSYKTVFEKLDYEGIIVPPEHRYYPYRATYDIVDTMVHPPEKERRKKLEWVNQHVMLSISVCFNVPEFTNQNVLYRKATAH